MKVVAKAEQAYDEATAKQATGRSLGEWFALLDQRGGPAAGRRELGNLLHTEYKVEPWWSSTILGQYEAAHGLKEKDGRLKGYTICSTKSIKASPNDCAKHFESAKALDAWLGSKHRLEFKDGGRLENADGNLALIKKINPGKSIRLIWEQPGVGENTPVEIKFAPAGAKTTVMVTHERLQTREEADGLRAAWGAALDKLKALIEAA
ncbi:SRPBCC domain-containing protein [Pseudomarimonas arenosa]|uniref:SRPBCC domain-containing protein n=1 Tax=Pseudomarimonas arenosa TaxID=2774145 RepID=A0AAW3ZRU6_9GAMM|nr:SRPBCC domain-containing protein [Pseudomarimonas arenosa]MBD8526971.1 SRPBCC domain-containing protein [Pseudomarimonas arenosa]